MGESALESALSRCPLFAGLGDKDSREVSSISVRQRYKKRGLIFSEGDVAKGFYVILSGKVRIFKTSPEGKEQIIHFFSTGDMFAEVALFHGTTYPASAEALTDTEILFFPKQRFLRLIQEQPQLSLNMMANLARMLRYFTKLVEELSLMNVSSRLAAYLLNTADRYKGDKFALEINKSQLASRLGTVSETLSRSFRKLKDQGIIEIEQDTICILNRQALEDISTGLTPM
ncbi:MAG: Crp/Fnr family transcriptional regulator [Deltaproteobacteria bacterium]|nr:Crp/Fnr family transcriptional regulator [Deltaproteobacteria bacterium]